MSIHEPATLLTDCVLAGLAGGLAWHLPPVNRAARWWRRTLGLTAASALVGGSYHGFAPDFPAPVADAWWVVTLLIICLLSATMALSLLHEIAPAGRDTVAGSLLRPAGRPGSVLQPALRQSYQPGVCPGHRPAKWPWRGLIAFKLAAFAGVVVLHPVFVVAILDYGLTLLGWAAAALFLRRVWRGWMLAAIALSVVAALVQQLHLSPSPHFNHNDLYHVIQALALYGFYRAGRGFSAEIRN